MDTDQYLSKYSRWAVAVNVFCMSLFFSMVSLKIIYSNVTFSSSHNTGIQTNKTRHEAMIVHCMYSTVVQLLGSACLRLESEAFEIAALHFL